MPLSNDREKSWEGWLIDGLAGKEDLYQRELVALLKSRNIPKVKIDVGTVNMWWRKESLFIDVVSDLDGKIVSTIHLQPYGTSLWVGRAAEQFVTSNYYKRMAGSAFLETIDRCIRETTLSMVGAESVHNVKDVV